MNTTDDPREAAELLTRILDAVPGGVVHVCRDGSIRSANTEALRILGLTFDDLTRRYAVEGHDTILEDGSRCEPADYPVAKVLATGEAQPAMVIGVRRAGSVSWAVYRAVPVHAPSGDLSGAIVTFLDITERKRAEEGLRRSEEKWKRLAQNIPDFVIMLGRDACVESINRVVPGFDEATVIGTHSRNYIDPASHADFERNFREVIETARPVEFEVRAAGEHRSTRWYESVLAPIVENGVVTRVLLVARDVTERRAMIASLAEKERLASIGMLAASVAHEIMNPLTYVLANLDMVVGDRCGDESRKRKALVEARQGAERMQQIACDLRTLGRTGTDDLFYVDARGTIETALRLCGPDVTRRAKVVLDLDEVPSVLASESRLCQVFINLFVNAAHAIEMIDPGRGEGSIHLRTRYDADAALVGIDITDTGVGIAPENVARLFEPFYTTKTSGTGLGLSICRDIVERMGGRIDVVSSPGAGSTFTVWLSTTRRHASSRLGDESGL